MAFQTVELAELVEQSSYKFIKSKTAAELGDMLYSKTEELVVLHAFINQMGLTNRANEFLEYFTKGE